MEPLVFKPILKEAIWGGDRICQMLNIENDKLIGENWTLSVRDSDTSVIAEGKYKDISFKKLIDDNKKEMLGDLFNGEEAFPLLVKIINANNDLSIQVHPDDYYALKNLSLPYGKTEMWYIIEAKEEAKIVVGLKESITKNDFAEAIKNGRVKDCLNYVAVKKGDVIDVPAGLVHAITSGLLIAEVQQNSDTTFRVYDYDRVDKNGKKRELHIDEALEVIDFSDRLCKDIIKGNSYKKNDEVKVIEYIKNKYFIIDKYEIKGKIEEESLYDRFSILLITDGEGYIEYSNNRLILSVGTTVFIPAYLGNYVIHGNVNYLKCLPNK